MNPVNWEAPEKNAKLLSLLTKKSKPMRLKKQALSEIASELKALADSSVRQYQMTIEAERKREERNMAFRKVESASHSSKRASHSRDIFTQLPTGSNAAATTTCHK